MPGTYTIDHAQVAKLLYGNVRSPEMVSIRPELRRRAQAVQRRGRVLVGKDSGRLAARITLTEMVAPPFIWYQIEGKTRYSYMHHQGTRPHTITGSLEFRANGRMTHARIVHHPGTRPNPFLRDALPEFMGLGTLPSFRV